MASVLPPNVSEKNFQKALFAAAVGQHGEQGGFAWFWKASKVPQPRAFSCPPNGETW